MDDESYTRIAIRNIIKRCSNTNLY